MIEAAKKRNHQIDLLRGLAILIVIGRHPPIQSSQAGLLSGLSWYWYNCGWMGVDLFFVLSGFLIGSGLFAEIKAEGSLNVARFLVKRAFKIWPGYIVLMLFLSTGLTLDPVSEKNLIWNWMHLQNYVASCRVQTWSLAVEEHFYLFLPAVLLVLLRLKQMRLVPVVAASIAIFCLVGRFLDLKGAHSYSHLRMDSLFFGVLLAYLLKFSPNFAVAINRRRRMLFCVGAVVVGVISFLNLLDWYVLTIGLTLTYIGFGAILLALISTTETDGIWGKLLFGPIARGIAMIGFYSYGIYLWHIEFGFFPALALYPLLSGLPTSLSWLCEMILFVTFSVIFGTIMSRLVELPMLRLRDKIVPKLFPSEPSRSP
ncbi:MAG: acyltransferase [Candidatus Melainabacteria bacterium]|nr:acyltransferase [Candidatus Melainabacteria bacterium]